MIAVLLSIGLNRCKKPEPADVPQDKFKTGHTEIMQHRSGWWRNDSNSIKRIKELLIKNTPDKRGGKKFKIVNCNFYSTNENNQLWIIDLARGSYGFGNAKVAASIINGRFSMVLATYSYDHTAYQSGNFATYTGAITIYDQSFRKLSKWIYKKGRVQNSKDSNCTTCAVIIPNPDPNIPDQNFCAIYPPLCENNWGQEPGPDNGSVPDPTVLMMVPPDAAGGGGGSSPNPVQSMIAVLEGALGLSSPEVQWLAGNPEYVFSLYDYVAAHNTAESFAIGKAHVQRLIDDAAYEQFVGNYLFETGQEMVWWEDEEWLDDPNNFNLDLANENEPYDELTAEEKVLIGIFPTQAYTIGIINRPKAFLMTDEKFGPGGGLNDKKDAFRHAFFNAINTRDVLPRILPVPVPSSEIVRLFAVAHESEVPAQLALEKEMDLFNNEVGINYCWNCFPGISDDSEIADDLIQKMNEGKMKYLTPLNFVLSPYWPAGFNGIVPSTKLKWTNQ